MTLCSELTRLTHPSAVITTLNSSVASSSHHNLGLIYLISAFASPLLGFLIDKTGRNVTYVLLSIAATLVGHAILAFTFLNPYFAVILMGVAYSLLASALWPIAALIIPESQLGTAYGEKIPS